MTSCEMTGPSLAINNCEQNLNFFSSRSLNLYDHHLEVTVIWTISGLGPVKTHMYFLTVDAKRHGNTQISDSPFGSQKASARPDLPDLLCCSQNCYHQVKMKLYCCTFFETQGSVGAQRFKL